MAVTVTLSTLRADVQAVLGDPNGDLYPAASVNTWINRALTHLRQLFSIWEARPFAATDSVSVVAATQEYAIAKEIRVIDKVTWVLASGAEASMSPVDLTDVESLNAVAGATSGPDYYYRRANFIGFLPKPTVAGTAKVYSQKEPDDLAADGDAITMPPWTRNVILFKAASYAASSKGDRAAKALMEQDYLESKMEMEVAIQQWQQHETPTVRNLWGADWDWVT